MVEKVERKLKWFFLAKADDERFSKFENIVEGSFVMFCYVILIGSLILKVSNLFLDILRYALLAYIYLFGIYIHKNPAEELGIAKIRETKDRLFNFKKKGAITSVIILVVVSIFVLVLFFEKFNEVLDLMPVFGEINSFISENAPWFQYPLAIIEFSLFQVLLLFFIFRKDNIIPSFKSFGKMVLIVLGIISVLWLVALKPFWNDFDILDFFALWYGYMFWGIVQQVPFLLYFNTRFRKGLPYRRISEWINILLCAFAFGFFHAPQWTLVVIAFLMEIPLARMFLHDETRNLLVAGILHGFMGTCIIVFTNLFILTKFV